MKVAPDNDREVTCVSPIMNLKVNSLKGGTSSLDTGVLFCYPSMQMENRKWCQYNCSVSHYTPICIFFPGISNICTPTVTDDSYFKNKLFHHRIHSSVSPACLPSFQSNSWLMIFYLPSFQYGFSSIRASVMLICNTVHLFACFIYVLCFLTLL